MKRCYEWIGRPEQLTVTRWNSEISEIRSLQLHGRLPGQIVTDQCPSCSSDTRWFTCYVHVLHILQVIRILKMLNESLSSWSDDNRCCCKLVNYTGCMPKLPGLRPMQLAWSCCWKWSVYLDTGYAHDIRGPRNDFHNTCTGILMEKPCYDRAIDHDLLSGFHMLQKFRCRLSWFEWM